MGTSRLTPRGRERLVGRGYKESRSLAQGMGIWPPAWNRERKTFSEILVVTSKAWGEWLGARKGQVTDRRESVQRDHTEEALQWDIEIGQSPGG